MPCPIIDFCRSRGDDYPDLIRLVDSAGAVIDITGWTFTQTIHTLLDPTTEPALFVITGVIVVPATNGIVSFAPTTVESAIAFDTYYHRIRAVESPSGDTCTLAKGKWEID